MSKHFSSKYELYNKISNGVNTLADNVSSTLGPRGRNVILQEKGKMPIITKDGVTVAKFVDLEDPVENAGAQIVKQASAKTNADAGDGTTTSTVLTRAIFNESREHIENGVSPTEIKRGIDKAVREVVERLHVRSRPVSSSEDISHIASISANNDKQIGELIALAVDKVGKDGAITIEEANSLDTTLDLAEGFRFDSGYAAGAFVNNKRRGTVRHENVLILIADEKIEKVDQILPALEIAARESKPLLVVANEIEGQALAALIMNTVRGSMNVVAVKAPRYGETRRNIMSDLALATGGKYFQQSMGHNIRDISLNDFGTANTIEISKNLTTVVDGGGNLAEVDDRINSLKEAIKESESLFEGETLQERITRLASGIAIVRVGAATKIEMTEKKHRIEDALEAVRSAQMEGIIAGGGMMLYKLSADLQVEVENEEQDAGVDVVRKALRAPFLKMCENSGLNSSSIESMLSESDSDEVGIDFSSGELVNLLQAGIIDPVKVTRCALQNAASVAGTLITTNYAIIE